MEIGDFSRIIGSVDSRNPEWVHIGKYVILGRESRIITHGPIRPFYENPHIYIEDLSYIGFRCIILPGVRIGKATIIGAGSVVTRNTEPYSIYAGNPIRFIRFRDDIEVLRTFIIRFLMNKTLGYVDNVLWGLLKDEHIKYIFDDGRYNDKRLMIEGDNVKWIEC
jgi:hypothetical protein